MTSFKIDLETVASHKKEAMIPSEMIDSLIMIRLNWSEDDLRMAPEWRIEQILFIWHLERIAEDARNR